jgi:uncharacterized protein DUF6174
MRSTVAMLLLLGPWLAGCPQVVPDGGALRAQIASHRGQWAAAAIRDYEFRFQQICFCGMEVTREVVVRVSNGSVASARHVDDGTSVSAERLADLPTIDGLFDLLDDALDRNAASIEVEFDAALGFPTRINIDFQMQVIDEERSYNAADLTRL